MLVGEEEASMTTGSDERAIRELIQTWLRATKDGDDPAVLRLIDDDALFLVAGREPFGKAEFGGQSDARKGVRIEGQGEVAEVVVSGDWAWARTHLRITITPPEDSPLLRTGWTLTVFRRGGDGTWRMYRDANFVG
jgi:uncharacterized protein (TIGR02246 family)